MKPIKILDTTRPVTDGAGTTIEIINPPKSGLKMPHGMIHELLTLATINKASRLILVFER